jgi:hypothetical protein
MNDFVPPDLSSETKDLEEDVVLLFSFFLTQRRKERKNNYQSIIRQASNPKSLLPSLL